MAPVEDVWASYQFGYDWRRGSSHMISPIIIICYASSRCPGTIFVVYENSPECRPLPHHQRCVTWYTIGHIAECAAPVFHAPSPTSPRKPGIRGKDADMHGCNLLYIPVHIQGPPRRLMRHLRRFERHLRYLQEMPDCLQKCAERPLGRLHAADSCVASGLDSA
jgi:hypothetical protein